MAGSPTYHQLAHLRQGSVAWRLLCAQHAPFVISFFHKTFISNDRRSIPYEEILSQLDNYLQELRAQSVIEVPTRTAKDLIADWSAGELPFISQRYDRNTTTPEVDLTAGAEKAIRWIGELEKRSFVGTESRLLAIFRLMEDLVEHTETDKEKILERLKSKRAELDREIEAVEQGKVTRHDETKIKERLFQLDDSIKALLGDFRQVEETFRDLDRNIKQKAITTEKSKGDFLDEVFGEEDAIQGSDQGKSFRAFWDLLLQGPEKEQFNVALTSILVLDATRELKLERPLDEFFSSLLQAGNRIQRVTNQLTAQLRKYLDDQAVIESKQVIELVKAVEQSALALVANPPDAPVANLYVLRPRLNLDLSKPLFDVTAERRIEAKPEAAESEASGVSIDRLFDAQGVDEMKLRANVDQVVSSRGQASLKEIIRIHPLEKGLAELLTYLKIASERSNTVYNVDSTFEVEYEIESGMKKQIELQNVILMREGTHGH